MFFTKYSRNIRLITLLLNLFLISSVSFAQSGKATLSGSVVDKSGAVLEGARIELLPLGVISVANKQGEFTLPEVDAGHYTLKITYVGFETHRQEIDLAAGEKRNLSIKLDVASKSEQILVTSERPHGEAEAINQTRTADNIVQILPSEVITSLPNANVADAIGRLPSVSLERSEGEGEYIDVRGTEPRLTNVTVDGITIPAPEPDVRQVRLDVIPSDLVDSIEINKTLSANQDGDGIGGSVNLRTKTATDQQMYDLYGNGGYTPILDGREAAQGGGLYGRRFGEQNKFGILATATYDYNGRGIDNIQPAIDPLSTFAQPFYDNDTIREYRYYRNRYGFSGSADYKINENSGIYMHGIFSDLKDWGDKWYYEPVSTALTAPGDYPDPTAASPSPKFYTSSKRPDASVGSLSMGGRHTYSRSWFTWELSAARSYEIDSAGNPKADFSWIGPKVYCNYNPSAQTDVYRPTFGCDGPNSPLENDTDWALKDLTTSTGLTSQLNLTAGASYARNYNVGSHFGIFEFGFKFRNDHKTQDATEDVYDGWATKGSSAIPMTSLLSGFDNTDFYDGSYFGGNFGPVSSFNLVQNYVLQNLSSNLDGYKTAGDTYPNIFHTIERITAGYAMNTIEVGKLHIQTGLRFEGTQMDTFGYLVTLYGAGSANCGAATNTGCGTPTPATNNPSYLDILPSMQLRYEFAKNSAIRAVYGRGVARPDPYQLVPYATEDDSASPTTVAVGNPTLRPEHANNYDLLYEQYLQPLGVIQGGLFMKQLTAPEIVTVIPNNVNLASLPANYFSPQLQQVIGQYPGDSITEYVNGENAYLYGFEANYQQHLSYLTGVLGGLGISANYSYTASREKGIPLRTDHPALQRQAPSVWNISPTYDTKHFSLRMGLAYNGASIYQYSWTSPTIVPGSDPSGLGPTGPSGDIYTLAHFQVDAQASYQITRRLSLMAYGLNLNNEVFGFYQGSTQFVNQREYYKPTYGGGLKYTFTQGR